MLNGYDPTTFYPVSYCRLSKANGLTKGSLTASD